MTALERVLEALRAQGCAPKRGPSGQTARCPAHDDRHALLSVGEGSDGRVLVHCFAGCRPQDVLAALGLEFSALFPEPSPPLAPPPRPAAGAAKSQQTVDVEACRKALLANPQVFERLAELRAWRPEALARLGIGYDGERVVIPVQDAAGKPAGVLRYQPDPKRRAGRPKLQADPGSRRELFPAPEAVDEGDGPLLLVDGEPDAVTAASSGLAAVGIPGVQGWRAAWAGRFRGRRVVVYFDCDTPGRDAARRVAADLVGVAAEVRVLDLAPGRDDGFDLTDFVLERLGERRDDAAFAEAREALLELAAEAPLAAGPSQGMPLCELLAETERLLRRWVFTGEEEAVTLALWVAHTHAFAARRTPYLWITSPAPECGKTTLLESLSYLVRDPWLAAGTTAASLYRKVDRARPTLLLDEVDQAMARDKEYVAALTGILNSGYRASGQVTACVNAGADVRDFATFCPKAFALVGARVPATLLSRSIRIKLERAAATDELDEETLDEEREALAAPVRDGLTGWGKGAAEELSQARPELPKGLRRRYRELWARCLPSPTWPAAGGPSGRGGRCSSSPASRASPRRRPASGCSLTVATCSSGKGARRRSQARSYSRRCSNSRSRRGPPSGAAGSRRAGSPSSPAAASAPGTDGSLRGCAAATCSTTSSGRLPATFPLPPVENATALHPASDAGLRPISKCYTTPDVADAREASNPHGYWDVADVADGTRGERDGYAATPLSSTPDGAPDATDTPAEPAANEAAFLAEAERLEAEGVLSEILPPATEPRCARCGTRATALVGDGASWTCPGCLRPRDSAPAPAPNADDDDDLGLPF